MVDISLPQNVLLKSLDGCEAIIAYKFEHYVNLEHGAKKAIQVIHLFAFVSTATDQRMELYECEPVEVVVNYN